MWASYNVDGIEFVTNEIRVLSFKQFLPADLPGPNQGRKKHLIQVWTNPGGLRTLSIGQISLKRPRRPNAVAPESTDETEDV